MDSSFVYCACSNLTAVSPTVVGGRNWKVFHKPGEDVSAVCKRLPGHTGQMQIQSLVCSQHCSALMPSHRANPSQPVQERLEEVRITGHFENLGPPNLVS